MWSFFIRTHQKIDIVAYRHLRHLIIHVPNLELKDILSFEGPHGPDATRLKKGASEPPWHFYDPGGENKEYLETLNRHYIGLVRELKKGDSTRAAFEAAWLAHALVDGLTPAHHFPYKSELNALYQHDHKERGTVGSHFVVKGNSTSDTISRSFRLIGPKGLLTTHTTFEAGAGMVIMPLKLSRAMPTENDLQRLEHSSYLDIFRQYVHDIEQLEMFERFYKRGWTPGLARDVRVELAPRMAKIVTLAWYSACSDAGLVKAVNTATKP